MNPRALLLLAACCIASACADLPPGGVGLGDPCLATTDCVSPYICISGRCAPSSGQLCTPRLRRCNGDFVEQCSASGDSWESNGQCAIACVSGGCVAPTCVAGTQQCQGNSIMQCLPNGAGYTYVQTCVTGCTDDAANSNLKTCAPATCTPYTTECGTDGARQRCNANGTEWVSDPCDANAVCISGVCTATQCQAGKERCSNGNLVAEVCNETGTAWDVKTGGYCQNGCTMQGDVASCPAQVCVPYSTQCKNEETVETCNAYGTAWISPMSCSFDAICVSGACRQQICTPSAQQCANGTVQKCNATGTAWDSQQTCSFGCVPTGASTVACAPQACQTGELRCCQPGDTACTVLNGPILSICTPDRSGFTFVQYCSTGCAPIASTTVPKASCQAPVCAPLHRTCGLNDTGQHVVQVCLADGSAYQQVEVCSQDCSPETGSCVVTDTSCTPGEFRCQQDEVQQCARLSDGSYRWEFIDHCFGGCSEGVCLPGGSCGCEGAPIADTLSLSCGGGATNAPAPVKLQLLQPTSGTPNSSSSRLPCNDGVSSSTFAVYTAPIVGSNGTVVPDGTMVTFSTDGTSGTIDSLIMSADADPSTPNSIERPTKDGVAIALVAAPSQVNCRTVDSATQAVTSGQRTVTVTAKIAGSCAGTLPIYFKAPETSGRVQYIAEDFSSTTHADRSNTSGIWDTNIGAAGAVPSFNLGNCSDGDFPGTNLTLTASYDLQANTNLMQSWDVASLTNQTARVNGVVSSVRQGDEVLVATIWGPSGSTGPGNYEFHHVASVDNTSGAGVITFTEPIGVVFGNGTNAVLTGHRVVLQRVPQFNNVNIPSTTVLTSTGITAVNCTSGANCSAGGGTGILAFRACGTLTVQKEISMDNKGLPQNLSSYPSVASTSALNRLVMGQPTNVGAGSTTSGGGVILISAQSMNFPPATATIHASGGSAGGGVVWLSGGSLNFGSSTRVLATGGASIPTGMARIDASELKWQTNTPMQSMLVTYGAPGTPYTNGGSVGAVNVQTGKLYQEPSSTGILVRSATLTGIIGGSGATTAAFQLTPPNTQLIKGVNLSVTANGADPSPTWVPLDSGSASITSLQGDVRFKLSLAPPVDKELLVRVVAFAVTIN